MPSCQQWRQRAAVPLTFQLEEAVTWCQGAFLEGFSIPDSAAFDEWALVTRESLQRELLATLQRLTDQLEALGIYEKALIHARRQVVL